MTDNSIQAFQPSSGALSAEHYQTFELAKENGTVLGGVEGYKRYLDIRREERMKNSA